jgi:hypothetical protein
MKRKNPTLTLPEGEGVRKAIPSPKWRELPENSLPFGEGRGGVLFKKTDFHEVLVALGS